MYGRTGAAGEQAQSEPTPHRGIAYTVYISPLLNEQILTVKIGKTAEEEPKESRRWRGYAKENTTQIRRYDNESVLYFTLCLLVLCFFYEMDIDWGFIVWWFNLAGALQASRF